MNKTATATTQHVFGVYRERCRTPVALRLVLRSVDSDAVIMFGTVSCYRELRWEHKESAMLFDEQDFGAVVSCFSEV